MARGDLQECPLQDIPRLAAWPEETLPEGEAVRRGPEEGSVVRASRWCGHLKEAIAEEEEEEHKLRWQIREKTRDRVAPLVIGPVLLLQFFYNRHGSATL